MKKPFVPHLPPVPKKAVSGRFVWLWGLLPLLLLGFCTYAVKTAQPPPAPPAKPVWEQKTQRAELVKSCWGYMEQWKLERALADGSVWLREGQLAFAKDGRRPCWEYSEGFIMEEKQTRAGKLWRLTFEGIEGAFWVPAKACRKMAGW